MDRRCGKCTACCTLTLVPELNKPVGTTCQFCDHQGCSVYPDRPQSCRDFECEWLKGELPEWARPDRIHVMFERLPVVPIVIALPEAGHESTWCKPRVLNHLKRHYQREGVAVVAMRGTERYALIPEGKTDEDVRAAFQLGAAVALGGHAIK